MSDRSSTAYTAADFATAAQYAEARRDWKLIVAALRIASRVVEPGVIEGPLKPWEDVISPENMAAAIRTALTKVHSMTDKADEIARETVQAHVDDWGNFQSESGAAEEKSLAKLIAAALRSYGKACRDEGLEEAAVKLLEKHGRGRGDLYGAKVVRSIKSSQPK